MPLLQLFHTDSVVSSTKRSVEKWKVFEKAGLFGMTVFGALGTMTFFFLDPVHVVRAINLATALTASIAVGDERNISEFSTTKTVHNGALETALE